MSPGDEHDNGEGHESLNAAWEAFEEEGAQEQAAELEPEELGEDPEAEDADGEAEEDTESEDMYTPPDGLNPLPKVESAPLMTDLFGATRPTPRVHPRPVPIPDPTPDPKLTISDDTVVPTPPLELNVLARAKAKREARKKAAPVVPMPGTSRRRTNTKLQHNLEGDFSTAPPEPKPQMPALSPEGQAAMARGIMETVKESGRHARPDAKPAPPPQEPEKPQTLEERTGSVGRAIGQSIAHQIAPETHPDPAAPVAPEKDTPTRKVARSILNRATFGWLDKPKPEQTASLEDEIKKHPVEPTPSALPPDSSKEITWDYERFRTFDLGFVQESGEYFDSLPGPDRDALRDFLQGLEYKTLKEDASVETAKERKVLSELHGLLISDDVENVVAEEDVTEEPWTIEDFKARGHAQVEKSGAPNYVASLSPGQREQCDFYLNNEEGIDFLDSRDMTQTPYRGALAAIKEILNKPSAPESSEIDISHWFDEERKKGALDDQPAFWESATPEQQAHITSRYQTDKYDSAKGTNVTVDPEVSWLMAHSELEALATGEFPAPLEGEATDAAAYSSGRSPTVEVDVTYGQDDEAPALEGLASDSTEETPTEAQAAMAAANEHMAAGGAPEPKGEVAGLLPGESGPELAPTTQYDATGKGLSEAKTADMDAEEPSDSTPPLSDPPLIDDDSDAHLESAESAEPALDAVAESMEPDESADAVDPADETVDTPPPTTPATRYDPGLVPHVLNVAPDISAFYKNLVKIIGLDLYSLVGDDTRLQLTLHDPDQIRYPDAHAMEMLSTLELVDTNLDGIPDQATLDNAGYLVPRVQELTLMERLRGRKREHAILKEGELRILQKATAILYTAKQADGVASYQNPKSQLKFAEYAELEAGLGNYQVSVRFDKSEQPTELVLIRKDEYTIRVGKHLTGSALYFLRQTAKPGFTLDELSEASGIYAEDLAEYEEGAVPSAEDYNRIIEGLGLDPTAREQKVYKQRELVRVDLTALDPERLPKNLKTLFTDLRKLARR